MSHYRAKKIVFIRHSFRGPFNITGIKEITIKNGNPSVLRVPKILDNFYNRNLIDNFMNTRTSSIIQENKLKINNIIADISTQRTYQTGKFIAINGNKKNIYGAPTETGNDIDYLVTNPPLLITKEEQEKLEKNMGEKYSDDARCISKKFIDNLGIIAPLDPDDSKSAYHYLGLPDWLGKIIEIIVSCAGFLNESLEKILVESDWPKPKYANELLEQANNILAYTFIVKYPIPDVSIGIPAQYIYEKFYNEQNEVESHYDKYCCTNNSIDYLISHDTFINSIVRALFPNIEVYTVGPLDQLIFEKKKSEIINVYGKKYKTLLNGSMCTSEIQTFLGIVTKEQLKKIKIENNIHRVKFYIEKNKCIK